MEVTQSSVDLVDSHDLNQVIHMCELFLALWVFFFLGMIGFKANT